MAKKLVIVGAVLALLGMAGLGVWAAAPLDGILSPAPKATAIASQNTWKDAPLTVVIVAGQEKCSYRPDVHIKNTGSTVEGWTVAWGFNTQSGRLGYGTLRRLGNGATTLYDADIPQGGASGSEAVVAGARYEIEAINGTWSITARPPNWIPTQEYVNDVSSPNVQARYCRSS